MTDALEIPLFMANDLPPNRPTLDPADFQVGSRVVVVPESYGHSRPPDIPGVVISRARVWCEIQADPDPDRARPRTWRMRIDTKREGGNAGYTAYFRTPDQWRFDQAAREADAFLGAQGIRPEYHSPWSPRPMRIRLARLVWTDLAASPLEEETND